MSLEQLDIFGNDQAGRHAKKAADAHRAAVHADEPALHDVHHVVRRALGEDVMRDRTKYTKMSIEHALKSPDEALEFAKAWGRGIDDDTNKEFVGMYVNDRTIDYKEDGRAAILFFIKEGQHIFMIRNDFDTATMRFIGEP